MVTVAAQWPDRRCDSARVARRSAPDRPVRRVPVAVVDRQSWGERSTDSPSGAAARRAARRLGVATRRSSGRSIENIVVPAGGHRRRHLGRARGAERGRASARTWRTCSSRCADARAFPRGTSAAGCIRPGATSRRKAMHGARRGCPASAGWSSTRRTRSPICRTTSGSPSGRDYADVPPFRGTYVGRPDRGDDRLGRDRGAARSTRARWACCRLPAGRPGRSRRRAAEGRPVGQWWVITRSMSP